MEPREERVLEKKRRPYWMRRLSLLTSFREAMAIGTGLELLNENWRNTECWILDDGGLAFIGYQQERRRYPEARIIHCCLPGKWNRDKSGMIRDRCRRLRVEPDRNDYHACSTSSTYILVRPSRLALVYFLFSWLLTFLLHLSSQHRLLRGCAVADCAYSGQSPSELRANCFSFRFQCSASEPALGPLSQRLIHIDATRTPFLRRPTLWVKVQQHLYHHHHQQPATQNWGHRIKAYGSRRQTDNSPTALFSPLILFHSITFVLPSHSLPLLFYAVLRCATKTTWLILIPFQTSSDRYRTGQRGLYLHDTASLFCVFAPEFRN